MATVTQIQNFFENGMVADAMGVPVEMEQRDSYHLTDMVGHGTYNQPLGTWSDDTSLTLCLAENLVEGGNADTLMAKFTAYLMAGNYTPWGDCFDIGITTRQAVMNYHLQKIPADSAGDRSPDANGNGALMRIAPLAFTLNKAGWSERQSVVRSYTTMTHGHERSVIASLLYVEILRHLIAGVSFLDAITESWQLIESSNFDVHEQAYFQRMLQPNFMHSDRRLIRSSGYVIDTLEAAIWCAANGENINNVILLAVNLGDDTDTVAQIAASLYTARHLDEKATAKWRDQLVQTEQSKRIIADFAVTFGETGM